jgi:hypothetical protein
VLKETKSFFKPKAHCGAREIDDKDWLEIGTNKASPDLSPIQAQQLYDARYS